jgi:hypothetical protein
MTMTDSPDLVAAKRLLDAARQAGFRFQRIARALGLLRSLPAPLGDQR